MNLAQITLGRKKRLTLARSAIKTNVLSCTMTEELVKGHCLIVPLQHCLSSLEMEDDDWDEVRVCPFRPFKEYLKLD